MGLLTRITNTSYEIKPCFSAFCRKYGFVHAGVFKIVDGMYILTNAYGIDTETIYSSVSTPDFWKGVIATEQRWYTFSIEQNTLGSFYQLFSEHFKSQLQTLHYLSFTYEKELYLFSAIELETDGRPCIQPEISDSFISEVASFCTSDNSSTETPSELDSKINDSLAYAPAFLLYVSFDSAIHEATNAISLVTFNLRAQAEKTILLEIESVLRTSFGGRNIVYQIQSTNDFRIAFFTKQIIDEQMMQLQITQSSMSIFNTNSYPSISFHQSNATQSSEQIKNFLLAE